MAKYVVKSNAVMVGGEIHYRDQVVDLDGGSDRVKELVEKGSLEAGSSDNDERQPRASRRTAADKATDKVEADKAEAGKE